jgi:tetratricopeptide (TPR) repeat protein
VHLSRFADKICIKQQDSLVELGIILLSLQQYEDSLKIFFEALAMRKKEGEDLVLPDDIKENNLQIAKVLNNIGCVNYEKGNYKQARESFEAAIRMQKKILGGLSAFSFTDPTKTPGFLTMASTLCNKGERYFAGLRNVSDCYPHSTICRIY